MLDESAGRDSLTATSSTIEILYANHCLPQKELCTQVAWKTSVVFTWKSVNESSFVFFCRGEPRVWKPLHTRKMRLAGNRHRRLEREKQVNNKWKTTTTAAGGEAGENGLQRLGYTWGQQVGRSSTVDAVTLGLSRPLVGMTLTRLRSYIKARAQCMFNFKNDRAVDQSTSLVIKDRTEISRQTSQ